MLRTSFIRAGVAKRLGRTGELRTSCRAGMAKRLGCVTGKLQTYLGQEWPSA